MPEGSTPEVGRPHREARDDTSYHVRRARDGDRASLEWIVLRFSPLLLAQAKYRMGTRLRAVHEPEDLVQDLWAITLPRLADLTDREGRATPVLLKFLSTTLLYRVNDLMKRSLARGAGGDGRDARDGQGDSAPRQAISQLPAETSSVVSGAVRRELSGTVAAALEELDPADREILILRGIEQNSNSTVSMLLGLAPSAVSMRFRRALERLKVRLPASVFEGLADD